MADGDAKRSHVRIAAAILAAVVLAADPLLRHGGAQHRRQPALTVVERGEQGRGEPGDTGVGEPGLGIIAYPAPGC